MSRVWYYRSGDEVRGPVDSAGLKRLAASGRVSPDTLVRRGSDGAWVAARDLPALARLMARHDVPRPQGPPATASSAAGRDAGNAGMPLAWPVAGMLTDSFSDADGGWARESVASSGDLGMPAVSRGMIAWAAIGGTLLAICVACVVAARWPAGGEGAGTAASTAESKPAGPDASDSQGAGGRLTTEQIVARSEKSVAYIAGRSAAGTGFVIAPRLVATNRHVIDSELMRHIKVRFPSAPEGKRGPYTAQLRYRDDEIDFALLEVDVDLPPLPLAESYTFRRGREVVVIGNPGLSGQEVLQNAVSRGVLSTQITLDGHQFDQLSISINPGNSGGPVLDDTGRVIGIATAKASKEEGIAFSIPAPLLQKALARALAMSPADVEEARSMHRARAVFNRVRVANAVYLLAMAAYVESMGQAIQSGKGVDYGLLSARPAVEKLTDQVDAVFLSDLEHDVESIGRDENLTENLRLRLIDFWTNHRELRSYVESPRGNFLTYSAKFRELADQHKRLDEALKLMLGVSD